MPTGLESKIIRISTGKLNTVNDSTPGAPVTSGTGAAQYQGQLGAKVIFGPDEVKYSSAIGTLYGGVYQYVRFRTTATAAPARGLIAFWDISVAENLYQVTNDESGVLGAQGWAGIVLNAVTRGYYGFIQIEGKASILFRAIISAVGPAIGDPVYCAGIGAGEPAVADVIRSAVPATLADVSQMSERYLGVAEVAPINSTISAVQLRPLAVRV